MTNVAILLTGQLRTYNMLKYLHMNTLISKYNADVFLSIDIDNSLQCENKNSKMKSTLDDVKNVIDFFHPVDVFVLDNFDEEFCKLKKNIEYNLIPHKLLFQQYFVVKHAYEMMINHINKTNKTRISFDIRIIPFSQYEKNMTDFKGTKFELGKYYVVI
jgi:hypothetical protein